ncbi:1,4-beta-xylanase [Prolixibacteraceae bacterium JC049]|nr:1,4-beta-xylanase [Prolixibacteraceae bacterium JC049]
MKKLTGLVVLILVLAGTINAQRWSEKKVNKWYKKQGWLVGANFAPSSAINQLEMWQAETFDLKTIDKELQWAEDLGFNTMRVFLHHMLWEQDSKGFIKRIEQYLKVADKHGIKTMLVLLDDVWHPYPKLGKQPDPTPHVHNSGWVQSPGHDVLIDSKKCDALEPYIKGIISHFKKDKRVVIWDIYNEPGNTNGSSYGKMEPKNKAKYSLDLLKKVYKWAREVNPSQPICIDVWTSIHKELDQMSAIDKFAYHNSDVINFHCYANAKTTENQVKRLAQSNRPLICTEYMARKVGSTFQEILPIFKKYNVAAYNWGFVSGKSQTIYPWNSWGKKYTDEPALWFHDIFRKDGTPYKQEEVKFIKSILK